MTKVTVTAKRAFPFSEDGQAVRRVKKGEKLPVNSSRVESLVATGKIHKPADEAEKSKPAARPQGESTGTKA